MTFEPAFGNSATSICASFGYEKSIFIGAYLTASTGYGITAMLPVFHDFCDWPWRICVGDEAVGRRQVLPRDGRLDERRATCCAPGLSFTVAGTFERSTAGRFVSGVAVLLPVFDQMIPAAIAAPTTATAMTQGRAFCQPGLRWISVRKTESASALIVIPE